jgi:Fur family peroxide stress response transcriptional regulator
MKKIAEKLKIKKIKITPQRVAIIKYLEQNKSHPTAEDIFNEIVKSLSGVIFGDSL